MRCTGAFSRLLETYQSQVAALLVGCFECGALLNESTPQFLLESPANHCHVARAVIADHLMINVF